MSVPALAVNYWIKEINNTTRTGWNYLSNNQMTIQYNTDRELKSLLYLIRVLEYNRFLKNQ